MKKKLFWVVVALLVLTVIVLVVVRSLPITYKGLALPTPAQVGPDTVLPPAAWLIVGDTAVLASYGSSCYRAGLVFGPTGCGDMPAPWDRPDLAAATLPAETPAVVVIASTAIKEFQATVQPWIEGPVSVPFTTLKAESKREVSVTAFTLEPLGEAGDQLLEVSVTYNQGGASYFWRLNPAPAATATPSAIATTLPSVEIPASCAAQSEDRTPYFNLADGYCLLYPAYFRVSDVRPGLAGFYGPPLDQTSEPVFGALFILVEGPVAGRTLAQVADDYVSMNRSGEETAVTRSTATLGGEPAEIVEGPGERTGSRQVFVLHNDTVYHLGMYPVDARFPQAAPDVAAVWQAVSTSFTFLPEGFVAALSSCPDGNDQAAAYLNLIDGYCLLYPSGLGISVQVASHGVVFSGLPSEPGPVPVLIDLVIRAGKSADGRSAAQVATGYLAQYPADLAAQVVRTSITVGGQPGEMIDGVPGRTQTRQAFVVYHDRVYEITLSPYNDPAFQTRQAEAEAAWQMITASFVFVTHP